MLILSSTFKVTLPNKADVIKILVDRTVFFFL